MEEDHVLLLWKMKDKALGKRTTSVLRKNAIKEPATLESVKERDSVKALYMGRRYCATVIKFGGKEELSRLHVNPETAEIINDPRVYDELMQSKKQLVAEAKAKGAAQARASQASNDDILNLEPAFQTGIDDTSPTKVATSSTKEDDCSSSDWHPETPLKADPKSTPITTDSTVEHSETQPPSKMLMKCQTPKVLAPKIHSSSQDQNRLCIQDFTSQLYSNVTPEIVNFLNMLASSCARILNSPDPKELVSSLLIQSPEAVLNLSNMEVSQSSLPCFQPGKGKVELAMGTGVYINRNLKTSACATAGDDPLILIRELLIHLVGKDRLRYMSAKGQNKTKEGSKTTHTPIPPTLLRVVQGFVAQWIKNRNANVENPPPEPIPTVNESKFTRTVNLFCGRIRRDLGEKEHKGSTSTDSPASNTRSSAKKRAADHTPQSTGKCKRSLSFADQEENKKDSNKEKIKKGEQTPQSKDTCKQRSLSITGKETNMEKNNDEQMEKITDKNTEGGEKGHQPGAPAAEKVAKEDAVAASAQLPTNSLLTDLQARNLPTLTSPEMSSSQSAHSGYGSFTPSVPQPMAGSYCPPYNYDQPSTSSGYPQYSHNYFGHNFYHGGNVDFPSYQHYGGYQTTM